MTPPTQDAPKEIPVMARKIPHYECTCGRVVASNIGKLSHRKKCDGQYINSTEQYSAQPSARREG